MLLNWVFMTVRRIKQSRMTEFSTFLCQTRHWLIEEINSSFLTVNSVISYISLSKNTISYGDPMAVTGVFCCNVCRSLVFACPPNWPIFSFEWQVVTGRHPSTHVAHTLKERRKLLMSKWQCNKTATSDNDRYQYELTYVSQRTEVN